MANYLAHHTKKKRILARKEADLKRLVAKSAPLAKLIAAAERVRDARLRVLRVQRSLIIPTGDAETQYSKLDARVEAVAATPASTILAELGYSCDGNSQHIDGA